MLYVQKKHLIDICQLKHVTQAKGPSIKEVSNLERGMGQNFLEIWQIEVNNSFSPIGSPIINKYYSTVPKIVHKSVLIIVPKIVLKIVPDRQQNSGLMALVSAS